MRCDGAISSPELLDQRRLGLLRRAQQPSMPVIGILAAASPDANAIRLRAFREGLRATGYAEGQNVNLEYRWAEASTDRLPELAAQLVHNRVAVIAAIGGSASALAAKAATTSIPVVVGIGTDPVSLGLVASFNRPGGNVTGVTNLNMEVGPKRLELLHELLPSATDVALLVNPAVPALAEPVVRTSQAAANVLGLRLHILNASSERDFDPVFATLTRLHVNALTIGIDNLFSTHSEQLAALTIRHALPAVYEYRPFVAAGGLMSYGSDETENFRLVGSYVGRILKGDRPDDLPFQQSTKVELIINLKTAKALDLAVPLTLLGRADEVIE
jgi:putative ABC transport system substrate-binding protein